MQMVKSPLLLFVLETDDVKQKTSLFYVQGKICLVFFHGFCCFVLCHQCPVQLLLETLKRLSTGIPLLDKFIQISILEVKGC